MFKNSISIVGFACCIAFIAGCQKDAIKVVPVAVTVTYEGAAVEGALVTFNPVEKGSEARSASGMTNASGKVTPLSPPGVKGVVPGKFKVTIMKTPTIGGGGGGEAPAASAQSYEEAMAANKSSKPSGSAMKVDAQHQLPVKYASVDTTDLEAEIVLGSKLIELSFDLKK